jgi:hypothetical protein
VALVLVSSSYEYIYFFADPPGPPIITGYNESQPIRIREEVNLTCTARGGNPPALLEWFKDGELVKNAYSRYSR